MADRLEAGVYVALATPLDASGQLAEDVLERLVERVIADGVTGIAVLGSTGEAASLDDAVRRRVQERVAAQAGRRVTVLSGVNDTVLARLVQSLEQAADTGMAAALVPVPSYYPPTPAEMLHFYTTLADRTPIPLVLYNIPPYTKAAIPVPVVAELAAHPAVIGLKDSGGQFTYLAEAVSATSTRTFDVFTGSDEMLLPSLTVGARGTICASANAVAPLSVGVMHAVAAGDWDRARLLQDRLLTIVGACRNLGGFRAWKAALEAQGFTPCRVAAPYRDLQAGERAELAALLAAVTVA